ncbi:MAG TPA: AAA family ATPase [Polyangiaceae bacterium]|jgi:serine/threonine protein kinase|nr:AAA family ATPase [Polyangiaceae bacterium]
MSSPVQRRTVGRYELLEFIGRGSAMEAYRAKSFGVEGFEKTLVVKRLLPELLAEQSFVDAFLEHVQRAMRLSHANLAQVFDLGKDEQKDEPSTYFLATERVSGIDVTSLLARARDKDGVPLSIAVYVALEVSKALDHAHRRRDEQLRPLGIVYGALGPHNVLVSADGDVKVTDFGVGTALLTLPRPRAGLERLYAAASPELAAGGTPSVEGDVFSLGALLYALVTGAPLHAGLSAEETLARATRRELPPVDSVRADVPPPLADIIARSIAVEPAERFPTASAFHEELLAVTYACGLRSTATELASFVEVHRAVTPAEPVEAISVLLSRPLTVPPAPLDLELTPDDVVGARVPSVPPLTGFGQMRHVSVLVLSLMQPLSETLAARLHAVLARYGGSVVAERENEKIALFGVDRSDGRDSEAAVRCGLVLVRSLDVGAILPSVGIDSGRLNLDPQQKPIPDSRTERLIGQARLLAGAERMVRVSQRIAPTLRGRFPLEPAGAGFRVTEFAQDGFADPFIGRKAELQHLGETLVRAARGELRVLSIVGDPGIGKTRLAVEMQQRLSRGSIDLVSYFATCPPRGKELPHSGILAMLRRITGVRDGDPEERIAALEPRLRALGLDGDEVAAVLGELGATAPSSRLPVSAALRGGFLRMLQSLADDRFSVFVWDDAHELDAASADVIGRAAARLGTSRIALVLCARPEPGAPYQSLPIHSELRLGELDPSDAERFVAQSLGVEEVPEPLLDFLRERAGGQPMFVEELVQKLVESGALTVVNGRVSALSLDDGVVMPRTLRALMGDRLRRLSDDERHLFVAAAVLEPPISPELLAKMLDLPLHVVDTVVDSLAGRALLRRDGPASFGFPSPLAREVVLAELMAEDLATLHRRAADAHAALLGDRIDEEADEVGYHLAAAGDRAAAADMYARGGLHALATRKLDRATLDLAYALDLADLESRPGAQIGNWLRALSTSVRYVRSGPNLSGLIDRLIRRGETGGMELALRAQMRIDLARILGALDQPLLAEALLDSGAAEGSTNAEIATGFLATHAELASSRGEFRLARRALDPLARQTVLDKVELHGITLSMARTLAASGKMDAAQAALAEAERLVAPEDPLLALDRAAARFALAGFAGKWRDAADASVQAAALAEELGLLYEVASCLSEQAVALTRLGDGSRARAAVASALSAAEEMGAERVLSRCRLVLGFLESIDAGRASLDAQRGYIAAAESRGWIGDALLGRYLLGRMAARLGAPDEARHELLLAARIALSTGNHSYADQCSIELAKLG